MKKALALLIFFLPLISTAQTAWTWTALDTLPFRVANNAVTHGTVAGEKYVYSFGGIDTTRIYSGIHKRAFRYSVTADSWEEIAPLPFTLSNIASGASTVNNIIYIFGGYHVYEGGSEVSSNEVIRYDPETNSYLTNGAAIPVPIDDHVQAVWRDSLIYLITGWSNTGNVPDVQIYNPYNDSWQVGTPTPNTNDYKAFGPSGTIIGDTIYYYGGASMGINFPARKILRKGVIDADDPTSITWTLLDDGPNTLYRSASLKYNGVLFWVGGSATSYNYNGIAYNGSGGVTPLTQIMRYDPVYNHWYAGEGAPYGIMDLRGIATISPTQWIICGGMEEDQVVTNKTFLLTYDPEVGGTPTNGSTESFKIVNRHVILFAKAQSIEVFNTNGQMLARLASNTTEIPSHLKGTFIIRVGFQTGFVSKKIQL